MKRFLLLASAASALIFSSCHKDKDQPSETVKLLKKVTQTKDGEDPVVYAFGYDAANRLTSVKNADNTEIQTFTYNALGQVTGLVDEDPNYRQVSSFTYNDQIPVSGVYKVIEKHTQQPERLIGERRMTYTVVNGQVEKIHVEHLLFAAQRETDFSLSYTNGNLTKIQVTKGAFYEGIYTYGTRKSAFPKLFDFILDVSSEHALLFGVKNEVLVAQHYFDEFSLDRIITTLYTYDTDGYVLTSNDGITQRTFSYE